MDMIIGAGLRGASDGKTRPVINPATGEVLAEVPVMGPAETVAAVKEELLKLKENIYGFENDSGKQDIVTGKIGINLAWSGDAVYAMDQADEETETELYYNMPETGGNIWFDGWVMPKSDSLNKELAQKFLNFISNPVNAAQNMDYIGYSSFIGGEDINTLVHEWYDVREDEWETPIDEWKLANDITDDYIAYDLTYFLSLIHISEPTRLLSISYAVFCLKKKKKQQHNNNCKIWNKTNRHKKHTQEV